MTSSSLCFQIIQQKNCPLYQQGEKLRLSQRTISCPEGKEVCLILVRDMTELLFRIMAEGEERWMQPGQVFNCSGCTGLIKFAPLAEEPVAAVSSGAVTAGLPEMLQQRFGYNLQSEVLSVLPPDLREVVLAELQLLELETGAQLIVKGEKNHNLYIVLEGELLVEDGGAAIAQLGPGELCGEMSYLGADVAVSTVAATKSSKVLAIGGSTFGRLLGNCVEVQAYMARLLASRLTRTSEARARDLQACMAGKINQVPPAELLQIFHMHQKTGCLHLETASGAGQVAFREGCIINARFAGLQNQEAIFKILSVREGHYRFITGLSPQEMKAAEIGDFMMLLMEGVRRVDELSG